MSEKKRVLAAMSGGVDSSVTAALLLEQGYEVIGVTMRLSEESREADDDRGCCSIKSVNDAQRVASILGIPHYVLDFRAQFEEHVICNFLDEYAKGRTPNPCIECNRAMKFGALTAKARELGAEFVATGHYARIIYNEENGLYELRKGLDERKDQSYVLYHLTQETLAHFLLPLGGFTKPEVREMAEKYNLPVAHKAESQEICFIPDDDHGRFLREHRPDCLVPGDIVDMQGKVLGRHQGVPLYTVGQRKGLGIAAPEPLYVTALDTERNRVIVGGAKDVFFSELTADKVTWAIPEPQGEISCTAKVRYGRREGACRAQLASDGQLKVVFDEPQRAVTPGQSVVLYDGDRVLGGGIIHSAMAAR